MKPRAPTAAALAFALALAPVAGLAAPPSCADAAGWPHDPAQLSLRMDNDAFGSASQDEGYSNGLALAWTSANLAGKDDACLSARARGLRRYLAWSHRGGFERQHLVFDVSHGIYTRPTRPAAT